MTMFSSVTRVLAQFVAALVVSANAVAAAAELDIVVDRQSDSIEFFMSTRADNFVSIFDFPPELLEGRTGTVDFTPLREGTWDIGDALLSKAPAALDGAPIVFEAMSLMVHPLDLAFPIPTPFDALLAISVCAVEAPETPPTLEELQGYVGFIAYVEDTEGLLTLQLPKTGRGPLHVSVREFRDGVARGHYEVTVPDGGIVEMSDTFWPPLLVVWILLALSGSAAASGALFWWWRSTRPNPAHA